ncbi:DMT family transporter [Gaetbulibacter saemankumensis]|uniref:DMT family transporter n=1 Tax=Gaetbulibacter saemankumensis TaxID=311208 RepID=UPI000428F36E|nr:DMT family transporter [Gaetbulibacter saemankumensis]
MKNQYATNLILITLATFLISTSGALGKHISLSPPVTIWWRSILGSLFIYLFCRYKGYKLKIYRKSDYKPIIISGALLGLHWITYFYALKLSNVAIGMLSLFTYPIWTAFLEPIFIKIKFDPVYILLGIMVITGLYILAPEISFKNTYALGILLGIFSALCYALRNIISKKLTDSYNASTIMFYQASLISLILLPVLFSMDHTKLIPNIPFILILALVTTTIGHTLLVNSLRHFSVSTASIISSTQPIFGIIIAYLFLNEIPQLNTFLGGSLIIATVIIESIRSRNK